MVEKQNATRSAQRIVSVLECFNSDELDLTLTEICRRVKLPKATTHRILTSLVIGGLLERNGREGKYTIGPALFALGTLYLRRSSMLQAAEPVAREVNELTGEDVLVAVLDRSNLTVVMRKEAKSAFRFAANVGSVSAAYASASGKALLSELTESEIDDLFPEDKLEPFTKKTITTKRELKNHLKLVKKNGIAFNIDEHHDGAVGIASVIRDANGTAVSAMSIAIPTFKFKANYHKRLSTLIKMSTGLISYRLGYHDNRNPIKSMEDIRTFWGSR